MASFSLGARLQRIMYADIDINYYVKLTSRKNIEDCGSDWQNRGEEPCNIRSRLWLMVRNQPRQPLASRQPPLRTDYIAN